MGNYTIPFFFRERERKHALDPTLAANIFKLLLHKDLSLAISNHAKPQYERLETKLSKTHFLELQREVHLELKHCRYKLQLQ